MKNKLIQFQFPLIFCLLFFNHVIIAQTIEWERSFGGSGIDRLDCIIQTTDNGYIFVGQSQSTDGDISTNIGSQDFWVVKLDEERNIEWEKSLGSQGGDFGISVVQSSDGGYLVGGRSSTDFMVFKLNQDGDTEWERSYGGSEDDDFFSMDKTADGGYVLAGGTESNDGDVTNNNNFGSLDVWILKINQAGEIEWDKTYGGSEIDVATSIEQTADLGFVVAAITNSSDGDISNNNGQFDHWILKLDSAGELEWEKAFGGSGAESPYSIQQTNDLGYIVTGISNSTDGDVTNNYGLVDHWIIKLDQAGELEWEKNFGGSLSDFSFGEPLIVNDGYMVVGSSESNNGDVSINNGDSDFWMYRIDQSGELEWEKSLGGSDLDGGHSIVEASNGNFIVGGNSRSSDGDVSENKGDFDIWLAEVSPPINTGSENLEGQNFKIYPNPSSGDLIISLDQNNSENSVQIHDMFGRLISSQKIIQPQLHITDLPKGIYTFSIISAGILNMEKVIIH